MKLEEALFHVSLTGILAMIFYTFFGVILFGQTTFLFIEMEIAFLLGGIFRMIFIFIFDIREEKTNDKRDKL